ncbi:hypothetical protein N333_10777, partial [Nestor notabilis]
NQWPLTTEKVAILEQLIQEQLQAGHICPSTSPWNKPVFVIPKRSGKWRLLHDLRRIDEVLEDMGPLQPGLPSPTMIYKDWNILVIDLKDCFFTIPIDPKDSDRFAFSVPSTNKQGPMHRCQWMVLSQGMKNSPTICQKYVDRALTPFWKKYPHLLMYHYMDDILIAGQIDLEPLRKKLCLTLELYHLKIAPEKVQTSMPWKYLSWKILDRTIEPQKVSIHREVQTLNDVQILIGNINWVRSLLGIDNKTLEPLFELLKGDTDL